MSDGPQDGEESSIWHRLRRRKVVQWGLAYAAGAWGLLQGLQFLAEAFDWPSRVLQLGTVAALIGLPIVLVLAWYHGDRGQQRVSRIELTIVTLLFLIGGGLFWRYQHTTGSPTVAAIPAGSEAAVAAVKTAIKTANEAYEGLNKAAKQAAEVAEASVSAATAATLKAANVPAPKAAAKKAA